MAHKQEQEDAQTEVTEVAKDILRMQLPIQMPGLGHVNMYCLLDGEGAAMWTRPAGRVELAGDRRSLEAGGLRTTPRAYGDRHALASGSFGGAARFAAETAAK